MLAFIYKQLANTYTHILLLLTIHNTRPNLMHKPQTCPETSLKLLHKSLVSALENWNLFRYKWSPKFVHMKQERIVLKPVRTLLENILTQIVIKHAIHRCCLAVGNVVINFVELIWIFNGHLFSLAALLKFACDLIHKF